MRARLALVLALTFTFSLVPVVAVESNIDTSTEGVRILRLPDGDLGTAVAINDSNWIATNASVWKGVGYPIDLWPELTTLDPGAGSLNVVDLDSTGEVVGTYYNGFTQSFAWTDPGGMEGLGSRTVTAVDGDIVGYTTSLSFVGRPGAFASIPDPSVGQFVATGIGGGLVLGNGRTWDGGGYIDLQENGVAYEVNSSGTIAGTIGDGAGGIEAAYWPSRSSAPVRLGFLGADTHSFAWAINDAGWIVGWSGTSTAQADKRAFLWRPGIGMEDLGFFPGDSWAEAFDINNAGVIVGKSGYGTAVWDVDGTFPMDYPPEVEPFGPITVPAGSFLSEPIAIFDYEGHPYTAMWTGLPTGANWDGSNLTWQTSLADQGSTYPISLTVTQDSQSLNTITIDTSITVGAPAPSLATIENQAVEAGSTLSFTASAAPGTAGNGLYWSIEAPTVAGASFDSGGPRDSADFSWSPAATDVGDHTVTVVVTEGACDPFDTTCINPTDEETFTISVADPGGGFAPVLSPINEVIDEHQTLSISRADFLSDPDTPIDDVVLTLEDGPDTVPPGALINGIFSWTPTEAQGPGTYEFTMRAADTSIPPNETTASIRITVREVNQAPVVDPIPPQSLTVGESLDFLVSVTDGDLPENHFEFITFAGPGFLDPITGQYTFTASEAGSFEFHGGVTDFVVTTPFDFTIEVTGGGNLPPDPLPDVFSTDEDAQLNVGSPGVLGNDSDPDGDPLLAVLVDPPEHGSVALDETGAFRYEPDPDFFGMDTFTYFATDGTPSAPVEVSITVDPVNDAPFIQPIDDVFLPEGQTLTIDPVFGDVDTIDLGHTWIGEIPPNAAINGIYVFTPTEEQGGQAFTASFAVTDGEGGNTDEEFTITVVETNQPPSLGVISDQQVFTGDPVTFDADATDADLPAQTLTYSLDGAPAGATIDPVTGEFSWPSATVGGYVFDVVVRDDWSGPNGEDRWEVTILVIDPLSLPNDVSIDLSVVGGDPDGDGIVDVRDEVTLRATIAETNLGVGGVNVAVSIPGGASLLSSTGDACESFTVNSDTVLACDVGTVLGSRDLDITVTLDDTKVYDIEAEVTSGANPETDVTNNTDSVTLEARIMISLSEMIGVSDDVDAVPPLDLATILEAIGVSDLVDVVPPLDLATILEAIAVGDAVDVIPPLTLDTILEAIGVSDGTDVVPPLNLATILENIAVADSGHLIHDSDGNGNVDITVVAVDPVTGEAVVETAPGTQVLVASGGLVPGTTATVYLFSDPAHLADVTVDAEGNFAVVVTIPKDTEPGDHRIIVTGEWADGDGLLDVIFPIHVLGICTITGTAGDDFLFGTPGNDVICGFDGRDFIFGGGGDDIVIGGPGNDVLVGGRGDDDLSGEEGFDILLGGRGDDHLVGGPGWDILVGGRGDDTELQ